MKKSLNHPSGYQQTALNIGFSMNQALSGVTDALEMAIIRVVLYHVGRENIISRTALVDEVHAQGFKQDERTIRLTISEMRRTKGIPIAGTGGKNGGYWLLKDAKEKEDYLQVQLHDPAINMLEQEKSVNQAFDIWCPGDQMSLSSAQSQQ